MAAMPCLSASPLVLLVCIALGYRLAAAACPVEYSSEADSSSGLSGQAPPLIFGGTYGSCKSGCQPRDTVWSNICKLDPEAYSIWGVCESWQRKHAQDLAMQISNGAMQDFSPCEFYSALGNRTLWLIGDSHVKGLFYSFRCFMLDFWEHSKGECAASSDALLQKQLELASLQGHPYNTPPRCLHMQGSSGRICMVHNPIGDYMVLNDTQTPGTLQLLDQKFVSPADIIYVAIGRWHANNCEGVHPSYAIFLEKFGAYVQEHRASLPNVLYGTTPHDHTKCEGTAFNFTVPYCLPAEEGGYDISKGLLLPQIAHDILSKYNIPVIDFYNTSMALFDGHVTAAQSIAGIIDCLHFCRPGMGEINIWDIYTAIKAFPLSPEQPVAADAPARVCGYVEPVLPKPFGPNPDVPYTQAIAKDVWGYPFFNNR